MHNYTETHISLKVGTFNVNNLAAADFEFYPHQSYNKSVFDQKTTWIAGQILKMKADIIGMQEVFSSEAMQSVIDKLKNKGQNYSFYLGKPVNSVHGPYVGLMVRDGFKVSNLRIIDRFEQKFVFFDDVIDQEIELPTCSFRRPLLIAEVELPDMQKITVVVVHLKSKRPIFYKETTGLHADKPVSFFDLAKARTNSLLIRALESSEIRRLLDIELLTKPNQPLILTGDLNDHDLSVTNHSITGEPPHRRADEREKRETWKLYLHNVQHIMARKSMFTNFYTYIHNGFYQSLDNILVSNHLGDNNDHKSGKIKSVRFFNEHLIDESFDKIMDKAVISDHGQVVAAVQLFRS